MARRFLTDLDLSGNELLSAVIENRNGEPAVGVAGQIYFDTTDQVLKVYNGDAEEWQAVGSEEFIGDSVANLLQSGQGIELDYNDEEDSLTISNTGVVSISGTEGEVSVSASAGDVTISLPETITADLNGNASTATSLETARSISLGGSLSGSASFDGSTDITITASIESGVVSSITGTEDQIAVSASAGDVTISLTEDVDIEGDLNVGNDLIVSNYTNLQDNVDIDGFLKVAASAYFMNNVEVDGNVTVHGDFNVDGVLNAINRTEINLEDNTIRLNSGLSASATPTENAGIIVERGQDANAALRWNETLDQWEIGFEDGSYEKIIANNDFDEEVQDIVGALISGSDSLFVDYDDEEDTLNLDVTLQSASPSYLLKDNGLAVDVPTLETQLISDGFTRKAAANVGNETNVSFALVHGFNTRDVVVNVYDNSTFDTVEVDVVRTDADTVTVTFAQAPDASAYRVVIIG